MARGRFVGLIGLAALSGGCGALLELDKYEPNPRIFIAKLLLP